MPLGFEEKVNTWRTLLMSGVLTKGDCRVDTADGENAVDFFHFL